MKTEPREFVFIVRLRCQPGAPEPHWRGSVQEVSSGGRRFITGSREIGDFIETYLRGERRSKAP